VAEGEVEIGTLMVASSSSSSCVNFWRRSGVALLFVRGGDSVSDTLEEDDSRQGTDSPVESE
jgi:hypothetical protein